jgi:FeS assembly protein IscX
LFWQPYLTRQIKAVTSFPTMKITWKDHEEIAWALLDKFPDQDPLKLSFPKLHKMVMELEEFDDKPDGSNEKILENIQMTWYEEKK